MTAKSGQWVHMVGIAGAGMSGIAKVLRQQGVRVSGSDLQSSNITHQLENLDVQVFTGHASSHVQREVDLVVISSAIPPENIEVQTALAMNIPVIKRGQMLARLVNSHLGLAVAGAHGKTTTSAMLYSALAGCELDPTYIGGGEIQGTDLNARLGQSDYFVVEADESDASFLDIKPFAAIITNIENDHLDFYKSMERIQAAFCQFLKQVAPEGFALLYGGDQYLRGLKGCISARVLLYGEDSELDYYLTAWQAVEMGSRFEVYAHKQYLGTIQLSIPGKHNALNALAVIALALELGQDFQQVKEAIRTFPGAKRRFQIIAQTEEITIVDDYAHHPTEIKTTIEAVKEFHQGRLIVVFQPHRYTRTKLLYAQFGQSFSQADLVVITGIYSAGEKPIDNVSGELIAQAAIKEGCQAVYIDNMEEVEDYIAAELRQNDLLITMGAGDIWKLGKSLAKRLTASLPVA